MKKIFAICAFVYLSLVLYACTSVPLTGRTQLKMIPRSEIHRMSFSAYTKFLGSNNVLNNTPEAMSVQRVGFRIKAAVEAYMKSQKLGNKIQDFAWEFNLVSENTVNAWCMPGGKVAFYTGILPICQDETGIAVVMGHEVAHAIAEHGNERMSQTLMIQGLLIAGSIAANVDPSFLNDLLLQAAGVGSQLGLLAFSRLHESEADRMGLIFMAMAGYDPAEAPRFWDRMAQQSRGSNVPAFLSTHPSNETRIRKLNEHLPVAQEYYKQSTLR